MATAIALFTRDLRVHDNPVLAAACAHADHVVPLFVLDSRIDRLPFANDRRATLLAECLADLDAALRRRGGHLVVRSGLPADEVSRVAEQVNASHVHVAADVSGYALGRERQLRDALASTRRQLVVHDAVHTVVAPGAISPAGSDHYAVFTPYWRAWIQQPRRAADATPRLVRVPQISAGQLPSSALALPGGETAARRRMKRWLREHLEDYADGHDQLAADTTSKLSPYLHLGCVSARELAARAAEYDGAGSEAFIRQLAWRDFHHQVLAARPAAAHTDYRPRGRTWRDDAEALAAWQAGMTGYPIVDAGMRQLAAEGWLHNRARLITAGFLTKILHVDWRAGAAHYFAHLLDGDVANNCLNWQWVAGTGTDTRPNRVLNPIRQAQRYDPDGAYVRRWVPELSHLPARVIHRPWTLSDPARRGLDYPDPIIDLESARELR